MLAELALKPKSFDDVKPSVLHWTTALFTGDQESQNEIFVSGDSKNI